MYVEPAGLCRIPSERVSVRLRTVSESSQATGGVGQDTISKYM